MPFVEYEDPELPGIKVYRFEMDPTNPRDIEFQKEQEQYRKSLARFKKKYGHPYWCEHEGREPDHPSAYWRNDKPGDPQSKHGVFCHDCGGYIQEG